MCMCLIHMFVFCSISFSIKCLIYIMKNYCLVIKSDNIFSLFLINVYAFENQGKFIEQIHFSALCIYRIDERIVKNRTN